MHFQGDIVPRHAPWIRRFALVGPSGETPMLGLEGSDPAGIARIPGGGLFTVVYQSNDNPLELEAAKFEDYLRDEGLERIIALRAERGQTSRPGHELFYRCAKALAQAGKPQGGGFDRALGLDLELVPDANPYALGPGGVLSVRLLYEGKPLEGALVMALLRTAPESPEKHRSDASGRAVFTVSKPGDWLIKAVHMIPARPGKDADWESFWASLTFRIGPPGEPEGFPSLAGRAEPVPPASPLAGRWPIFGGLAVVAFVLLIVRLRTRSAR
jgi:Domain of unknown function (DUF4198)